MSIDLICLGVGNGLSYGLRGEPSSSFVVRVNNKPKLLVDCGAGVVLSYLNYFNDYFPNEVYISHNHMDHAGDLPLIFGILKEQKETKPRLLGHSTVLNIIKKHRFHEISEDQKIIDEIAEWVEADVSGNIDLGNSWLLNVFRSKHSYICYGFTLTINGNLILGYTADSAYDEEVYDYVTRAPVAIVSGRDFGNNDHASLSEIDEYGNKKPTKDIWVLHYDKTDYKFTSPNVKLLKKRGKIILRN